jgi:hypothetical protein
MRWHLGVCVALALVGPITQAQAITFGPDETAQIDYNLTLTLSPEYITYWVEGTAPMGSRVYMVFADTLGKGITPTWISGGPGSASTNYGQGTGSIDVIHNQLLVTAAPSGFTITAAYLLFGGSSCAIPPSEFCTKVDGLVSIAPISGSALVDELTAAVPLPASLPLLATGLGVLGLFEWRRRRTS